MGKRIGGGEFAPGSRGDAEDDDEGAGGGVVGSSRGLEGLCAVVRSPCLSVGGLLADPAGGWLLPELLPL